MRKNVLFLLVFLGAIFSLPNLSEAAADSVVLFEDKTLEKSVRETLSLTDDEPLTEQKIQALVTLDAEGLEIHSLKGLEKAINLEELNVSDNNIESIEPILNLTKLQAAEISYNPIEDLGYLMRMTSLQEFDISGTNITDIFRLTTLPNLAYVSVMDLDIDWYYDRSAWQTLDMLIDAGVEVDCPPYGPVEFIESVTSESAMRVEWEYHGDWAENTSYKIFLNDGEFGKSVEKTFTIKGLKANTDYSVTIAVLKDGVETGEEQTLEFTTEPLPSGKIISMEDKVLEGIVKEELLVFNRSLQVSDLESLTEISVEKDLGVRSLKGLEYAVNLAVLEVPSNLVSDLSPLSQLKQLQYLDVNMNKIANFKPLSLLPSLEYLDVSYNPATDLAPLKSIPNLKELHIDDLYNITWKKGSPADKIVTELINRGVYVNVFEYTGNRYTNNTWELAWYFNGVEPVSFELYMDDELLAEMDGNTHYYKWEGLKPYAGYHTFDLIAAGEEDTYEADTFNLYTQSWNITGWSQFDYNWNYFDPKTFKKRTGWLLDGGKWYFLDANGIMKTGWVAVSGKWYYFNGSGSMKTGWLLDGGKWYYLNTSGAMAKGWLLINKKWYYFYPSGEMAKNTVIGGYKLGADGAWIK
ncbi:hypothetical protein [Neobacillus bataviensis]|uniref:hypothetical protein n=1 Tax=Neobacillus bataviensis TaxID=220685 RepID=UPI001CBD0A69|nr:hypothetical protein [Neobacillus bataviensis]